MTSDNGDSARARLIKTRRGTWIDKSLLPEARRECLEILRRVACESEGQGIVEMLRGERERLEDYPLGDLIRSLQIAPSSLVWLDSHRLNWAGLLHLRGELYKYRTQEERDARRLAHIDTRGSANVCGCCSRELMSQEPAYFGAKVYVGLWPLRWNMTDRPRICEPQYERTVLCGSCAPEWLSPERDDVVTQLCAYCERPMVSQMKPSELRRMFCSDSCQQNYHNQLRKEKSAEAREKVCEVCSEEFTATKRDAKTCSKACKQKAYRQRKKEVKQDQ